MKEYTSIYCINDVEITISFIEKILEIVKEFNITKKDLYSGPSMALKIFIKIFNKNRISFVNSNLHDKLTRLSYYGGRCEVYGNPIENDYIFHYDFSGMYSQCMMEKFAYGNYTIKTHSLDLQNPGYYWINFNSNMEYPVLPIHDKKTYKLLFVNGNNLEGCYWFEEINLFLNMGGSVNKIYYSIEFDNYDYVFNEYSLFFNKIREKGGAYSVFGKNMNNFLYGRMGLSDPNEFSFFIEKEKLEYGIKWSKWEIISMSSVNDIYMITVKIDDNVRKQFNINKINFKKNVSIASAITSKARIKLYNAQQDVMRAEGRILYSDTDSIFAAFRKNVSNERHGEIFWDIGKKDTVIKDAVFINPKTYAILYTDNSEIVKVKGFISKDFKFNELKENFYNDNNMNKKIKIIKKKNLSLKSNTISKFLNLNYYDKRKFDLGKKNTKPLFIENK